MNTANLKARCSSPANKRSKELLVKNIQQRRKIHILTDDKEDIVLGRFMEETAYEKVIDTRTFLHKTSRLTGVYKLSPC